MCPNKSDRREVYPVIKCHWIYLTFLQFSLLKISKMYCVQTSQSQDNYITSVGTEPLETSPVIQ